MSGSDLLPPGWAEVTVGDLFEELRAKVPADPNSSLPFIGMDHVESDTMRLLGFGRFSEMKSAGTRFHPGDVLYGRLRPYLNKVLKADFEGVSSAEFLVFPQVPTILCDYLKFVLTDRAFVAFASHPDNVTGDRPRIDFDTIKKYPLYLPPSAEQARIVSRIEELFSDLDKGEENLRRAQAQLKRYRQSVLKAAVTGELTRAWREQNADKLESGEALLKRILKARREAWEKAELEKLRAKGKPPKDDAWKARYVEPQGPDTEGLPKLPQGWAWATVEQLASGMPRSIQSGPFGSNLLHSEFQSHGILAIGIDNVREGAFSLGSQNRISQTKYQDLAKYTARPLDFVITVMATVGRCAVLPKDLETAIITKHVYRVTLNTELFSPYFLMWCFMGGPSVKGQVDAQMRGQTRPGINGEILKQVAVPVPSREEQAAIIDAIEAKLSDLEAFGASIGQALQSSAGLRQSILKAAFSGKLVPQDPNDEPAEELLKRIAAERTGQGVRQAKSTISRTSRKARAAAQPSTSAHVGTSALAAARKAAGLSQAQLAKRTGINQAYLSQMETGKRTITADQATTLARALGIEPSALTLA